MLIGEGQDWLNGEEQAWNMLAELDPADVRRRAKVLYDKSAERYILPIFNTEISVSPKGRQMLGNSPTAEFLLNNLSHYSRLSALWYLIQVKDIPLTGKLVNPGNMSEGQIFFKGSHALPLNKLTEKYASDIQGFLRRGKELGGVPFDYGDASLKLFPFPRIPVVLLLWTGDTEFPARADLLFDSTCSIHLPMDIIWSTAMMTVLIMLYRVGS
ncbi:MAG: DUF3786 domain-containing protein [Chloroflexi bacterium]|nr:DUF3786 domain-containing protein [Chloroflexota bacterium]